MGIEPNLPLRVTLIGNYKPDGQESMERFCLSLADGLKRHNVSVRILKPEPILGRLCRDAKGLGKWLGYLDKFILFPVTLKKNCEQAEIVHVCDHSNAMYLNNLKSLPRLITCHDLLAVRAGLGEQTYCPITPLGKILQRLILRGLKSAPLIACDSIATKKDVERLTDLDKSCIRLISLGLNYPYGVLDEAESLSRLDNQPELKRGLPFILHVGSSEPRKNRDGILRIFAKIKDQFGGKLVFAGGPLTPDLRALSNQLGVNRDIIEIVGPDNKVLEALYNRAFALLYPSYSEGFGWPIIEAQACGCPVITSNRESCREIAGQGAVINTIEDEDSFAGSLLQLKNEGARNVIVQAGFANLKKYDIEKMVASYIDLYKELLQSKFRF
jgi:glycosyltransferase involved in cell wall biosynthesis